MNITRAAASMVSPAVRDYLGLNGMDVTSWRFVNYLRVAPPCLLRHNNTS